jgi:hemoglobin
MSTSRATSVPALSGRLDLNSRERIAELVRDFYRDVAMDDLLGPIFAAARVDWPTHLATLTDFWAKQLLDDPGYDGNPLRAHAPLHARTPFRPEHYQRWLDLFVTTIDEHFTGPHAELAKHRARRMARALERLLSGIDAPGSAPIEVPILADTSRTATTGGTHE